MTDLNPGRATAPERLVDSVLALMPRPAPSPIRGPAEQLKAARAQARLVADAIWREAHLNGQVYVASMRPPAPLFMCGDCPNKEQVLEAFNSRMGRAAEQGASLPRRLPPDWHPV